MNKQNIKIKSRYHVWNNSQIFLSDKISEPHVSPVAGDSIVMQGTYFFAPLAGS